MLVGKYPDLINALVAATADENIRVRYLSSLELGSLKGENVTKALAQVALRDGDNPWSRAAVLSGIGDQLPAFFQIFRRMDPTGQPAFPLMMKDLGELFGNAAQLTDCEELLHEIVSAEGDFGWRMATVLGLLNGLEGRNILPAKNGLIDALATLPSSDLNMEALKGFIGQVTTKALDEREPLPSRVAAVSLMGYAPFDWEGNNLKKLLKPNNPPEIQIEAVKALAKLNDPRSGLILRSKETWAAYTPRVKSAVISAMVSRTPTVLQLFTAIEEKVVAPAEIPSTIRQRLMSDGDNNVKLKATSLFNELEEGGRMAVYEEYLNVLENPGDPELGKVVFLSHCSSCHAYTGEGGAVGPDLTGVNNQPADALLLHTLVPNYEVLPAYQATSISTKDGRSIAGWISAESENSITLRTASGTDESILRSNIVTIHHSGLSLMPDGLEQNMKKEDMANLIAFLKSGGL
jgi:putative heme-binding domain-containing protein